MMKTLQDCLDEKRQRMKNEREIIFPFFSERKDPKLHIYTLENGFSYWIRPHFKVKDRAKLQLIFRVGSIFENEEQQGLAHILEHMAFHGSENCSKEDLEQYFETIGMSFGAHVNAQTGFEKTVYMIEVPTDQPEQYQKAFEILRDWCSNLLLETEEIEKERKIGLEEYRQALSGMWRVKKQLLPKMYIGGKQVNRLPIGTKEALEEFHPDALRAFYKDWYQPQFAGLIVVGDVDVEETSKLIERLFSNWENTKVEAPHLSSLDIDHEDLWVSITDQEVPYPICGIVQKQRMLRNDQPETYFKKVCFSVLEDILNHRFAFLTRDKDCELHNVYCVMQDLSLDTEGFFLQGTFQQGVTKKGIYRFIQELRSIQHFGVYEEEVERSKSRLLEMFHMLSLEEEKLPLSYFSNDLQTSFLSKDIVFSLSDRYQLEQAFLAEISVETINELLQTILPKPGEGNGVVFQYVAPIAQKLTVEQLQQFVKEAMELPLKEPKKTEELKTLLPNLPKEQGRIAEHYHEKYELTEWCYSNGARVWLKPTSFQAKQIRFRAIGQGGYCWSQDEQLQSAKNALDISHYSGAGEHSADELDLLMSSPKARMSFHVSDYYHSISGYAFLEAMEKIWQYFWLRTQYSNWQDSALEKVLEWKHTQIQNQDNDPNKIFSRQVRHTLWDNHVRKKIVTISDLEQVALGEAEEFFQQVFLPAADMTYIFVGAFTLEDMAPILDRYIGGLPFVEKRERHDAGERMFQGKHSEILFLENEEKARVHLGWIKRGEFSSLTRFAFNYLRMIFEDRLRKELRERLGGTYHVHVSGGFLHYPEALFHMEASFSCEPDRVDELKIQMLSLLQELQQNGATQEELDITTTKILRQLDEDEKEDSYWLALFANVVKRQKKLSDIFDVRQAITELNLENLQEMGSLLLYFEDQMEVILLPQDRQDRVTLKTQDDNEDNNASIFENAK